jgi:hypothetical protein
MRTILAGIAAVAVIQPAHAEWMEKTSKDVFQSAPRTSLIGYVFWESPPRIVAINCESGRFSLLVPIDRTADNAMLQSLDVGMAIGERVYFTATAKRLLPDQDGKMFFAASLTKDDAENALAGIRDTKADVIFKLGPERLSIKPGGADQAAGKVLSECRLAEPARD